MSGLLRVLVPLLVLRKVYRLGRIEQEARAFALEVDVWTREYAEGRRWLC